MSASSPSGRGQTAWACVALAAFLAVDGLAQIRPQGTTTGRGGTAATSRTGRSGTREYPSNTTLGSALIEVDQETRSLIVIADDETSEEIQRVIQNLDRPKPQVLIKVLFLEVTHSKGLDVGLEGSFSYDHNGVGRGSGETLFGLAQQTEGGFYRVLADDWNVTLRAIARDGELEVLSRPTILARNNQEAVIIVGEEVPFVTNSQITNNGQINNTIQYADVGIILRVTPFITTEGLVEMIVAPEISTLTDQRIPISETVNSPVIAKRSAETVVVTPNGRTVVIGGLMETQKTRSVRKVPILGDIPLLGMAFRRTVNDDVKKELIIFLTPYIVENPAELSDLSRREAAQSKMAPEVFSEDQLNRYFDEPDVIKRPPENGQSKP